MSAKRERITRLYLPGCIRGAPAVRGHEGLYPFLPCDASASGDRPHLNALPLPSPPPAPMYLVKKAMGGPTCPWEPAEKSSRNIPVAPYESSSSSPSFSCPPPPLSSLAPMAVSILLSRIPSHFFATEGPHGRFDRSHGFVEMNSPAARLR